MKNPLAWLIALTVALAVGMLISLCVGPVSISVRDVFRALFNPWASSTSDLTTIWKVRLPRIVLDGLIGMGLGTSGAALQGLFRNPLADPFLIGASSGAALGATLAIISGVGASIWGIGVLPASALVGAVASVLVVYQLAAVGGQTPMVSLVLAGTAVSSFLGAVVSLLMYISDDRMLVIYSWLLGSTSAPYWDDIAGMAPLVCLGVVLMWSQARGLDALGFGEESTTALGVNVKRLRQTVILSASMATAASVAACGIIGFVGLIAPHVARLLVGARHAVLIPASGLVGALLLLIADDLARVAVAPAELPLGVVTALFGAPFFLYILRTRQSSVSAW